MRCSSCGLPDHDLLAIGDGEPAARRQGEVTPPPRDCPVCRRRLFEFRRTANVLRIGTPPRDDPAGRAAIRARLERVAARERVVWWRRPAATVAALPLVVLLLLATVDRLDLPLPGECPECSAQQTDDEVTRHGGVSQPSRLSGGTRIVAWSFPIGLKQWSPTAAGDGRQGSTRLLGERIGATDRDPETRWRSTTGSRSTRPPLRVLPPGYPVPGCASQSPRPVLVGGGHVPCR